jgi:lipopolysaccharide heptosyltransferase II
VTLLLIRILSFVFARLPEAASRFVTAVLGGFIFHALPGRRRLVLSNLHHAFPDRPHAWHVGTARASCRQLVETGLLALIYPHLSRERVLTMVKAAPTFHAEVTRLLAAKRPIVGGVPHLGAWELAAAVPLVYGDAMPTLGCVYRPLDHPKLDAWVRAARERFGIRMLSRKEGFSEGMRILHDGGALVLLFDQSAGDRGELTLFMDRVCSSTNLPGLMVEKFDAQLATTFVRRVGFWRYVLEVQVMTGVARDAGEVTRRLDRWLETLLRADDTLCASWLWLHNRWKTQNTPARRFRLEHKRSLLPLAIASEESTGAAAPKSATTTTAAALPRRTRFFVRLPNWLGDVVMALPLLRALRVSRPDAEISVIAKSAVAQRLERSGLCDDVLPLPSRGVSYFKHFWKMRRRYPDCWVLLTNSARGDLEAWCARAPQRFGMTRPGKRRPLLTHAWRLPDDLDETRVHQLRVWEKFFQRFGLRGELDLAPVTLAELPRPLDRSVRGRNVDGEKGAIWIGLICGTENFPAKRWPVAHWRSLIEKTIASGEATERRSCFVLFGTPADRVITQQVAAGFDEKRVVDLAGKTNLLEFAGALKQCEVVVTNDTGGMHLANALGVRVIALFGPTNPVRTGPVFSAETTILQPPGCAPTGGCALDALPPETVLTALREIPGQR